MFIHQGAVWRLASPAADAISQMRSTYSRGEKKFDAAVKKLQEEYAEQLKQDYFFSPPLSSEVENAANELFDSIREIAEAGLSPFVEDEGVHRKKERRKSKNLNDKVHHLFRLLNSIPITETDTLQRKVSALGYILDGLYRLRGRFDRYTEFKQDFPFKGFNVVNKYGYSEKEMKKPLNQLAIAADALQQAGYGKLNYGEVLLVDSPDRKNESARYFSVPDNFRLQVRASRRFDMVYTIVHELGHRWWFQFLTDDQRRGYIDDFALDAKWVYIQERQQMWAALEAANYWPTKAAKLMDDPELREELPARFRFWLKRLDVTIKTMRSGKFPSINDQVKRGFLNEKNTYVRPQREVKPYESVTNYARTNVLEDFADVFAFHVFDKPIPKEQQLRFFAVVD